MNPNPIQLRQANEADTLLPFAALMAWWESNQ